jgi:hypothetical protein
MVTGDTTDATTGGELPDCSVFPDMAACSAMAGCCWDPDLMSCVIDCMVIKDEATCNGSQFCMWFEGTCYSPI